MTNPDKPETECVKIDTNQETETKSSKSQDLSQPGIHGKLTKSTLKKVLKRPRGRPKKVPVGKPSAYRLPDPEQMQHYGKLGMTLKQVCDAINCDYSTIYELFRIYPQLKDMYLQGKSIGIEEKLVKLDEHIREGSKGALFFWLERIGGFTQKFDHTLAAPEKPPVDLSVDQQRRMAQAVLDAVIVEDEVKPTVEQVAGVLESGQAEVEREQPQLESQIAEGRAILRGSKN